MLCVVCFWIVVCLRLWVVWCLLLFHGLCFSDCCLLSAFYGALFVVGLASFVVSCGVLRVDYCLLFHVRCLLVVVICVVWLLLNVVRCLLLVVILGVLGWLPCVI